VAKKKYDPLWEIVGEKRPLQGQEQDVDLPCPHCNVLVHLGVAVPDGAAYECGLCGGRFLTKVASTGEIVLERA